MKDKIKTFVLRLVFSRLGPTVTSAVSVATGFLLGWIVSGTSAIGFHLDATQQTTVSLGISQTIYWLITELVNKYAGEYAAALQKAIGGIAVDRWIGPDTVAAAQANAQIAAESANPSTGEPPTEIYEGKPVATLKVTPKPKNKSSKAGRKMLKL